MADGHTEKFPFEQGVCQGCILSPMLFNACGEAIMRQVKETVEESSGSIVGERSMWNIRYADDTTPIVQRQN